MLADWPELEMAIRMSPASANISMGFSKTCGYPKSLLMHVRRAGSLKARARIPPFRQ